MKKFFELQGEAGVDYLQFSCMWCQEAEPNEKGFCSKKCEESYFKEVNEWLLKENNP